MCLVIKDGTAKQRTETNILVYKCLDYDVFTKTYCTPFQYMPIDFDNDGIVKLFHNSLFNSEVSEADLLVVKRGFHAYRDFVSALEMSEKYPRCGTKPHKAIIPKYSLYYVGSNGDIVADKMIIFEDEYFYNNFIEKYNITPTELEF